MIYTVLTKKAMCICYKAHEGQLDKAGLPYVNHPFHVAESMNDENTTIVALLHDVVEDTSISLSQLEGEFPPSVIEALNLLTHQPDVPYLEYIKQIKQNDIATVVKIADLKHNSDLSRLDHVSDEDIQRVEKYKRAMSILSTDYTLS